MKLLNQPTIKSIGLFSTAFFWILTIICVILTGIMYRYIGPDWRPNPWASLPGLTVAVVVYSFVIGILGFMAFAKPNITFSIMFSVLVALSFLFTLAIAIMALIAASHGFVSTYFDCDAKFTGIMEVWQGVDTYLQKIDQNLCSPICPCLISNPNIYSQNTTVSPSFSQWNSSKTVGSLNFQNCSELVQTGVYKAATLENPLFDPKSNFDPQKFARYMSNVENEFKCSGWCNVTYVNPRTTQQMTMYKYLFSDVNRGPVERVGCLEKIINWVPPYLNASGALMIFAAFFQLITLIMAMCQCWKREEEHELQIPHENKEERKE